MTIPDYTDTNKLECLSLTSFSKLVYNLLNKTLPESTIIAAKRSELNLNICLFWHQTFLENSLWKHLLPYSQHFI